MSATFCGSRGPAVPTSLAIMRLTKFDHACVLIEDGEARVLIDPGAYTPGFETLTGLTGVLITHQHADHLDPERIGALLNANPDAAVHADQGGLEVLAGLGIDATLATAGDRFDDVGTQVDVFGALHAVIHPDLPTVTNVGYLLGGRFFHPGDAFTVPGVPVDVLGLPIGAPWLKLSEAIDYLRTIAPRIAIPIHEAVLAKPAMYYGRVTDLAPDGTTTVVVAPGETVDLDEL